MKLRRGKNKIGFIIFNAFPLSIIAQNKARYNNLNEALLSTYMLMGDEDPQWCMVA